MTEQNNTMNLINQARFQARKEHMKKILLGNKKVINLILNYKNTNHMLDKVSVKSLNSSS